MIIREAYKKIFTFLLLLLFLISTSGVVLFYHFCAHAHQTIYSFYIDETEELCAESAMINGDIIPHDDHCCNENLEHHNQDHNKCCKHHQSFHKALKLNTNYTSSKQLKSPKPLELLLLFDSFTLVFDNNEYTLLRNTILENTPPEAPTYLFSGKDIVTNFCTLKLDC